MSFVIREETCLVVTLWKRGLIRDMGTSTLACHLVEIATVLVVYDSLELPGIYRGSSHLKMRVS